MEEKRWLKQSVKDMKSAKDSSDSGHYEWACFQSQQAAEKLLRHFFIPKD